VHKKGRPPHGPWRLRTQAPQQALITATTDKNWTVRAAALEAIAERGDRSLVAKITAAMDDDKELVRFMAAACVAHLSDLPLKKVPAKTRKP
jgi:HEAT repeat protein